MAEHDYKEIYFYADKNSNLLAIPTGLCLNPDMIVGLNIINILEYPYSDDDVEQLIFETFDQCYSEIKADLKEPGILIKHFGRKDYSKAMKKLKLLIIRWDKDIGYSATPIRGDLKQNNVLEDKIRIIGLSPEKGETVTAIKQAFEDATTA